MAIEDVLSNLQVFAGLITDRVVVPLVILFLGIAAAGLARNLITRLGAAVELDKHGKTLLGQRMPVTELAAGGTAAVLYTVSAVWALVHAGIAREFFLVVLGAIGALATIGLALWLRDLLPNLMAGRQKRQAYKPGEAYDHDGVTGVVERVGRLALWIKTPDGRISVPYRGL